PPLPGARRARRGNRGPCRRRVLDTVRAALPGGRGRAASLLAGRPPRRPRHRDQPGDQRLHRFPARARARLARARRRGRGAAVLLALRPGGRRSGRCRRRASLRRLAGDLPRPRIRRGGPWSARAGRAGAGRRHPGGAGRGGARLPPRLPARAGVLRAGHPARPRNAGTPTTPGPRGRRGARGRHDPQRPDRRRAPHSARTPTTTRATRRFHRTHRTGCPRGSRPMSAQTTTPASPALEALPPAGRAALRAGVVGNWIDNIHVFLPVTALAPAMLVIAGPGATASTAALIIVAMLMGRPVGGVVFGRISDRLGRTRTTRIAI